uniref:Uncharacterized protein n=1 Tax=Heterorhabditis bacteriophora TaxID=37862 RepID=A0A1I7W9H7_HETBA
MRIAEIMPALGYPRTLLPVKTIKSKSLVMLVAACVKGGSEDCQEMGTTTTANLDLLIVPYFYMIRTVKIVVLNASRFLHRD